MKSNDATVFLGKDNDIVLVGEAPANGWRKSHKLWCDVNVHKILPIYYPSHIFLKSYKGNISIFKNMKNHIELL